jgi:hypothetical protein
LAAGSGESPFCPHCGAPQLYLSLENQSVETGGEPKVEIPGAASTGALPPPRPQQVDWKMAIRCAAAVAGVAGVLSLAAMRVDMLSPLSTLWILSGSLITLGLYQRRRPLAWMDAGVGARIGMVVGLCLALALAIPMAVVGVIERFGLHSMASFDLQMAEQIEAMQKTMQQQSGAPVSPDLVRFFGSPEFRGGVALGGFALVSLFLLVLSMAGGAFAGLLQMRRKAAA